MTFSMRDVVVVITARNEADNIGAIIEAVPADFKVFVMDDGSTDNTGEAARRAGAVVFAHAESQGLRDSLLELWRNAYSIGATAVVQLDAGRSHLPEQMLFLLTKACQCDADIVIGSRFVRGGSYVGGLAWRKLGSRAFGWLCRLALPGLDVRDWTSGYRVFSRRAILMLQNQTYLTGGHTWQAEVLAHAAEAGLRICETPISYIAGRSSIRPGVVWDMLNTLSDMFFHRRVAKQ